MKMFESIMSALVLVCSLLCIAGFILYCWIDPWANNITLFGSGIGVGLIIYPAIKSIIKFIGEIS